MLTSVELARTIGISLSSSVLADIYTARVIALFVRILRSFLQPQTADNNSYSRFFVLHHREPTLFKRGKTCKAVRAGTMT